MGSGVLDQPRARIFSVWTGELCPAHARAVATALLPKAAGLTTAQLVEAISKAAIELDPQWARRRYEAKLRGRRVEGLLRPDGLGELTGYELPADQVAAACNRLDEIARQAKAAGHPDCLDRIRADLFLGQLDGSYAGLDDTQLLHQLLANLPAPNPTPDGTDANTDANGTDANTDAADDADGSESGQSTVEEPRDPDADAGAAGAGGGQAALRVPTAATLLCPVGRLGGCGVRACACWPRWALSPASMRARAICRLRCPARRTGPPGHGRPAGLLVLRAGRRTRNPARRRLSAPPTHPALASGTSAGLPRGRGLAAVHPPGTGRAARRSTTRLGTATGRPGPPHRPPGSHRAATGQAGPPNGDPADRQPNAALRRWIQLRDRRCTFPGCRLAAHRCDMEHARDHAAGGPTTDTNVHAACGPDHDLKTGHGWHAQRTADGETVWTSPLGHSYRNPRPAGPETTTVPMPDPTTPADDTFTTDDDGEDWQNPTCLRDYSHLDPVTPTPAPSKPAPPPPPNPDDDIPPF